MKRTILNSVALFCLSFAFLAGCSDDNKPGPKGPENVTNKTETQPDERKIKIPKMGSLVLNGPVNCKNLSIYFISLSQAPKTPETEFITLDEGVKSGKVLITEGKNTSVQQLVISNNSKKPLFIAAGELVKGGKQDRTLQTSLIVPAGRKGVPIPSFCVEQSRWNSGRKFAAQGAILANKSYAGVSSADQSKVWSKVAHQKKALRDNVSKINKKSLGASKTSSMNEELNQKEVKKIIDEYKNAMNSGFEKVQHPVGFIYAVDGKFTAGYIFKNSNLFKKLWPKYAVSVSTEALSGKVTEKPKQVTDEDLRIYIANAFDGKSKATKLPADNRVVRYFGKNTFTFESFYKEAGVYMQVGNWEKAITDGQQVEYMKKVKSDLSNDDKSVEHMDETQNSNGPEQIRNQNYPNLRNMPRINEQLKVQDTNEAPIKFGKVNSPVLTDPMGNAVLPMKIDKTAKQRIIIKKRK